MSNPRSSYSDSEIIKSNTDVIQTKLKAIEEYRLDDTNTTKWEQIQMNITAYIHSQNGVGTNDLGFDVYATDIIAKRLNYITKNLEANNSIESQSQRKISEEKSSSRVELGESASDEFCREGFKSLWVYFCSDVENRQKASVDSAMNDPRCGNFRKAYKEIAEKLFCGSDAGYTGKQAYEDALTKLQELAQPAKKEKPLFSFSTPKEAPSAAAFEKKAKGMIEAAKTQSATPQKR